MERWHRIQPGLWEVLVKERHRRLQRRRGRAEVARPQERRSLEKQGRWGEEEKRGKDAETSRSGQWRRWGRSLKSERGHCREARRTTERELLRGKERRDAGQRHRSWKWVGQRSTVACTRVVAAEPGLVFLSVVNTS